MNPGQKIVGDIVEVKSCSIVEGGTTCVVNASNESATLGGGVSRALREECGPALQAEMKERLQDGFGGCLEEGDCMVTGAGASERFRFVLHVPSVDYRGPKAVLDQAGRPTRNVTGVDRVRACTEAALQEAARIADDEQGDVSVTFPLLGAGSGGLSVEAVARTMRGALIDFFSERPTARITRIVIAVPESHHLSLVTRLIRGD